MYIPQSNNPIFHVVFEEVPLHVDVLDLLTDHGVLRVCNRTLVVFPYGGSSADGLVKDPPIRWRRRMPSLVAFVAE
jgi:hypothetical protein